MRSLLRFGKGSGDIAIKIVWKSNEPSEVHNLHEKGSVVERHIETFN